MPEALTCPLCRALAMPVPLSLFVARTQPFLAMGCRCDGGAHRPLMAHPHHRQECLGFDFENPVLQEVDIHESE
jgi:hypothetical protein